MVLSWTGGFGRQWGRLAMQDDLPGDLPNLPEQWFWQSLDSLVDRQRGICYGIVQPGRAVENGVPILRANDIHNGQVTIQDNLKVSPAINDRYQRSQLRGGEILVTLVGAYFGKVALAPAATVGFNTARAVGIIPIAGDASFAAWALRAPSVQRYMQSWANTTAQPTLNLRDLARLPIPTPPLDEQRRIAGVLGALDDKIELNRRMNETLEAMAQAIFKSWFIDFDGVDESDMVDSELGPIPKGWEVGPIDDIVELIGGGTPKKSNTQYWGGEIPWFSVRDVPSPTDIFVVHTEQMITEAGLQGSSARLVPAWTTIISARGTVGKLAVAAQPMAFNQSCYGVRSSSGHGEVFVHFALRGVVEHLQRSAHGSVFDTITRDTFKMALCVVPPVARARSFEDLVNPVLQRILLNVRESRTLAELRDTLLPKLISGEIRVPAAKQAVEAVI